MGKYFPVQENKQYPVQAEHFLYQRKKHQYTQKAVADKIGCTVKTYRSFEHGDTRPKVSDLLQLSELYHVSTDYLLGLIEERNLDLEFVCKYTGLSENTIDNLHTLKIDVLNKVLLSEHFKKILEMIKNSATYADSRGDLIAAYITGKMNGKENSTALLEPYIKGGGDVDMIYRTNVIHEAGLLFDKISNELYNETH